MKGYGDVRGREEGRRGFEKGCENERERRRVVE